MEPMAQRFEPVLMTPAERLAWLEEMLDELLPLVGRAQDAEKSRKTSRP